LVDGDYEAWQDRCTCTSCCVARGRPGASQNDGASGSWVLGPGSWEQDSVRLGADTARLELRAAAQSGRLGGGRWSRPTNPWCGGGAVGHGAKGANDQLERWLQPFLSVCVYGVGVRAGKVVAKARAGCRSEDTILFHRHSLLRRCRASPCTLFY